MIYKSDDGKSFNQDQAIDLLVSLVATDLNSEKKWRSFSITPYQALNYRMSGTSTGNLERVGRHIKKVPSSSSTYIDKLV